MLAAKLLHLVILTPARQGPQREFTAKLAFSNRTKHAGITISVVDLLGSVQSGVAPRAHSRANELEPLTGPLAPVCEARTIGPPLTFNSLTTQHVSNIDPTAL